LAYLGVPDASTKVKSAIFLSLLPFLIYRDAVIDHLDSHFLAYLRSRPTLDLLYQ
jgi:hypothetical protein